MRASLTLITTILVALPTWATPALKRPAGLSPGGVGLWETLVEGRPRWRNWRDLMFHNPTNPELAYDLYTIVKSVTDQLGTDGPALYRAATGQLYDRMVNSPEFRRIAPDLTNPAQWLRDQFASHRRTGVGDQAVSYAEASAKALGEVRDRYRLRAEDPLSEEQRRELAVKTWRYQNQARPGTEVLSRRDVEAWRAHIKREAERWVGRERAKIVRELIRTPKYYADLNFLELRGGRTLRPLASLYAAEDLPPLLSAGDLTAAQRELRERHFQSKDQEELRYDLDQPYVFIDDPVRGLLGVFLGRSQFYYYKADEAAIYDPGMARKMLLLQTINNGLEVWREVNNSVIRALGDEPRLTVDSLEHAITSAFNASWYAGNQSFDWVRDIFSHFVTHLDYGSYGFEGLPIDRKMLYAWQIMTKGFEFWRDRSGTADLPSLDVSPDLSRWDLYDSYRNAFGSDAGGGGLGGTPSERARGNRRLDDPDRFEDGYVVRGRELPSARWRVPSAEALERMTSVAAARGRASVWVRWGADTAHRLARTTDGRRVLPIPVPEGYAPTQYSVVLPANARYELIARPEAGVYALDFGRGEAITLKLVEVGLRRVASTEHAPLKPLTFTAAQLAPAIARLREIGANDLAESLIVAHVVSAERLARLMRHSGVYSCAARPLGEDGLAEFVGADGRLRVQCHLAAEILRELLNLGLSTHPWRDRVALEIVISAAYRAVNSSSGRLGFPLHAELDVLIDGRRIDTLDATPLALERLGEEGGPAREPLRRLVGLRNDLSSALATLGDRTFEGDLPPLKVARALRAVERVRRAELGEEEADAPAFRREVAELTGRDLGKATSSQIGAHLSEHLAAWRTQLEHLVAYDQGLPRDLRDRGRERAGAEVLLGGRVVAATYAAIDELLEDLGGCEDRLLKTRPGPADTPW